MTNLASHLSGRKGEGKIIAGHLRHIYVIHRALWILNQH